MHLVRFSLLTAALWATAALQSVCAQQATVTGKLINPNSEAVVGLEAVTISLTNQETKERYTAPLSRDSGEFTVTGLPPGTYDLMAPLGCCLYRPYQQKDLVLAAGETRKLELAVQWGINLGTIGDDPVTIGADLRARAGDLTGPTPRTAAGKPDFTGVWSFGVHRAPAEAPTVDSGPPQRRAPKMKPWAAEIQEQLKALNVDPNPAAYCLPSSATPSTYAGIQKFIQTPEEIVQLTEWFDPGFRQIFLDGRKLPEYWNPSWLGHSVGHWEGDTLVVESTGFNEIVPMPAIHSDKLRIVEKFTRPDLGHVFVDITAEDPEAWEDTFHTTMEGALLPDEEILEWICAENNRKPVGDVKPWRGRP